MLMLVKFTRSKGQRAAGISASIKPSYTAKKISFKAQNSVNTSWLESQGIDVESGDDFLVEVTESLNTYPVASGGTKTEWQLTVNNAESKFAAVSNAKVNSLVEKGIDLNYDETAVKFAPSNVETPATPARIGNTLIETAKTVISQEEFDAKLAEAGTDVAKIAAVEATFDVQF